MTRAKTISKRIWSLTSFWRWLIAKGYTENNPWLDHGIGRYGRSTRDKQPERSFTAEEMRALLSGNAKPHMHEMMRLAALSGATIEELWLLQVQDTSIFPTVPQSPPSRPENTLTPTNHTRAFVDLAGRCGADQG